MTHATNTQVWHARPPRLKIGISNLQSWGVARARLTSTVSPVQGPQGPAAAPQAVHRAQPLPLEGAGSADLVRAERQTSGGQSGRQGPTGGGLQSKVGYGVCVCVCVWGGGGGGGGGGVAEDSFLLVWSSRHGGSKEK